MIASLNQFYGVEIDYAKAKEEKKKSNTFKHLTFEASGNVIQVYFNGTKTSPYEVALIFEYPRSEQARLVPKIDLCLESFAVGDKAKSKFNGAVTDEEATEAAAPPPTAF